MMHAMIDIETLGLRPDTVVHSIGVCLFDQQGILERNMFYRELTRASQVNRSIDASTLEFWKNHGGVPAEGTVLPIRALTELNEFLESNQVKRLWANGTDFDIPIIKDLMGDFGIVPVWKYNAVRDYRTIRSLFPGIKAEANPHLHRADFDALYQAKHLVNILNTRNLWEAA